MAQPPCPNPPACNLPTRPTYVLDGTILTGLTLSCSCDLLNFLDQGPTTPPLLVLDLGLIFEWNDTENTWCIRLQQPTAPYFFIGSTIGNGLLCLQIYQVFGPCQKVCRITPATNALAILRPPPDFPCTIYQYLNGCWVAGCPIPPPITLTT